MDVFFVEKISETPNAQVKTLGCKMSSSQSIPTFKKNVLRTITEKQSSICLDHAVLDGTIHLQQQLFYSKHFLKRTTSEVYSHCLWFCVSFTSNRVWYYYLYSVPFFYTTILLYSSEINMEKMQLNMETTI